MFKIKSYSQSIAIKLYKSSFGPNLFKDSSGEWNFDFIFTQISVS